VTVARIVCVAPAPAIDRLEEVESLVPGAIHRPVAVTALPGGKGLNVLRAVHALGGDAIAVGILAGHAGRWIEAALAERGLVARTAWGPGETRTCVSILDRSTGALTEIYEPSPPVSAIQWAGLLDLLDEALTGAGDDAPIVTISGGVPIGAQDDAFAQAVRLAHRRGARVLLDAYGPGLDLALPEGPELVKINVVEATASSGVEPDAGLPKLAAALCSRGARSAVVTDGVRGAFLHGSDSSHRIPPPSVAGAYPTGSGDAFLAGIAVGLAAGHELAESVIIGADAAAANALRPGGGELDPRLAADLTTRLGARPR
jgi:1-phosphofructokinase family hexose kinase